MLISQYRTGEFDFDGSMLWPFPTAPKKVYIAASMDNLQKVLVWTVKLTRAGFEVVSRWPSEHWPNADVAGNPKLAAEWAQHNVDDMDSADTLVLFSDEPSSSGGYHFELGYAIAQQKNVVVIGPRRSVFYHHKDVRMMRNERDLVEFLQSKEHGTRKEINVNSIEVVSPPLKWPDEQISLSEEAGF